MTFKRPFQPKLLHDSVITGVPLYTGDLSLLYFPQVLTCSKLKCFVGLEYLEQGTIRGYATNSRKGWWKQMVDCWRADCPPAKSHSSGLQRMPSALWLPGPLQRSSTHEGFSDKSGDGRPSIFARNRDGGDLLHEMRDWRESCSSLWWLCIATITRFPDIPAFLVPYL